MDTTTGDVVLTFRGINKTFATAKGPYVALENVALDIYRGEFVA